MEGAIRKLVESMPSHLREQHRELVEFLRDVAGRDETLRILADTDADGMSAHAFAEIARHIGVKNISVQHVERNAVSLKEPGAYVLYDITATPEQEKGQGVRVANVDHHQPRKWPEIDVISNPFYGVENPPREYYAYNPSVQLVSIAKEADYNPEQVAIFAAIGAVGDRSHQYLKEVNNFVNAVAKAHGMTVSDLEKIADLFELPERFPDRISPDDVREIVLEAIRSGKPMNALEHRRIRPLLETWEEVLQRNRRRIEEGMYDHGTVKIGNKQLRIVVYHVPEDDARRVQKIKSALGSYLLDKFKDSPEPIIVAAGQLERGDVINYRIGANPAAVNAGLHAGDIARALAGKFGLSGGGHAVVAGAKIPHTERDRAMEHLKDVLRQLYGKR